MPLQTAIPLIDVSQDEVATAKQVYKACTEQGFMYVTGHGVSQAQLDAIFSKARAAFALPPDVKQAMISDENSRGWTPFAEQTLDPANQSRGDTKEGFYFGRDIPLDHPEAALPLHGPNQWPPEELIPGFKQVINDYFDVMVNLGRKLLRLLALSLGLSADYFKPYFTSPHPTLRFVHYSAEVSAPAEGVFGAGAHSDWGMLTMLMTDDVPGLQVLLKGQWHDVPPIPGAFIVNLGDMLERWTNGVFKSTVHRVINTTGRERYSIPFFFEPNFTAKVECLPCCITAERPAGYPPTTAGDHLVAKYAQTHAGYGPAVVAANTAAQVAAAT